MKWPKWLRRKKTVQEVLAEHHKSFWDYEAEMEVALREKRIENGMSEADANRAYREGMADLQSVVDHSRSFGL